MPFRIFLSVALLLSLFPCISNGKINTSSDIFNERFYTLSVTKNDNLMSDPVLTLGNGDDYLTFSFDELTDDRSYLRARILHCNADWQPSQLAESEYVDGFNQADIDDYGFSSNTFVHYVNYKFTLPQEGLRPLVSGNYLLQVYDVDDPETTILQARFRVSEGSVDIGGEANGRTDRDFNDSHQQLSLSIAPIGVRIPNPYSDVFVEVTQNMRPDMSRTLRAPSRILGDRIIYDHSPQLIFPAGNEYRRFETVRNNYPGMGVESTFYQEPAYHAVLAMAEPRNENQYYFDRTQRGRYKIDEYNSTNPDLGADYIVTHFTLQTEKIPDADVYLEGDLFMRGYSSRNRMRYIPDAGVYALTALLKQGSYNYQYVVVDNKQSGSTPTGNAARIEGNHFETLNEYNVYVWLRTPGARADRLIGSQTILATP